MTVEKFTTRGSIPIGCQDCGARPKRIHRVFRNYETGPGGRWIAICDECLDLAVGPPIAERMRASAAAISKATASAAVEGFVAVPKPNTREVAIVFKQGHVIIAEAEARALVDTLSGALAILAAEHPAQELQTQGAA